MKKLIFSIALIGASLTSMAAVPGKTYAPGDTIMVDGYEALVYYVTPDGQHGSAMLPPALAEKDRENAKKAQNKALKAVSNKTPAELYAESEKNLAKLVKSGHMTQEKADATLSELRQAMEKMDSDKPIGDAANGATPEDVVKPIKMDKKFMSREYHIDEWKAEHPDSWTLANVDDGARIIKGLTGGLGREYQYSVKDRSSLAEKYTKDLTWQNRLNQLLVNGFIVIDQHSGKPYSIMDFTAKITPKHWMELTDTCTFHEMTVAVTNF
ncbi:MAG: hypothetical protein K2M87_06710 [Muribaculaceae bacterium]|nr:hypothetical protein [Muribaculaceae bacterium]